VLPTSGSGLTGLITPDMTLLGVGGCGLRAGGIGLLGSDSGDFAGRVDKPGGGLASPCGGNGDFDTGPGDPTTDAGLPNKDNKVFVWSFDASPRRSNACCTAGAGGKGPGPGGTCGEFLPLRKSLAGCGARAGGGTGEAFCCGRFKIWGLKTVACGVVTLDVDFGLAVLLVLPISVGLIFMVPVPSRRSIC
jgi:hypothetical protein